MKKANRFTALLMCIAMVTVMFAACSGDTSKGEKVQEPEAPETTVIRLAVFEHGHVFNAIAEQQGYYKEEGISVETVPVVTDEEVFKGIENGTIDIASNSGTNLPLQRISEGQDLTIFGGYLLTGCMPIFTKVDTPWTSIEDLIGKTMACEPNLYAITGPLLDMGHDPINEITWYQPEDQIDRIKAVKEGKADYGLVGTQLNYAINRDPEIKVCTYASDILPNYSCCRVEAKTEWVNENPNTVKALLRSWIRAMSYYDQHHDETVAMVAGLAGKSEEEIRAYMDNPHLDLNIGPMKASVKRAWDYMDRLGLLSTAAESIDIEDHINVELYKSALDECQAKYGSENSKFYEEMQGQFAKYNTESPEEAEG